MVNYIIGLCLGFSIGVLVGGAVYGRMSRTVGGGQVPPKTNPSVPPKRNPPPPDLVDATPSQQTEAEQHTDWQHGRTAHLSSVIQQLAREPAKCPKCVLPPEDESVLIKSIMDGLPVEEQVRIANGLFVKNGLPPVVWGKAETK